MKDIQYLFRLKSDLNIVKNFIKTKNKSQIVNVERPKTIKKVSEKITQIRLAFI